MAHMAVVFAKLERDFIRSRTREALAVRRHQGVVLGRPRSTPSSWTRSYSWHAGWGWELDEVVEAIAAMSNSRRRLAPDTAGN
jgi:DNA invertase Pin-like site-specific DNA recombinase